MTTTYDEYRMVYDHLKYRLKSCRKLHDFNLFWNELIYGDLDITERQKAYLIDLFESRLNFFFPDLDFDTDFLNLN